LLKLDYGWAEIEVAMEGIQSNQINYQADQELNPGLDVKTKKKNLLMQQFWHNCGALANQKRRLARTISPKEATAAQESNNPHSSTSVPRPGPIDTSRRMLLRQCHI
jgi:hypothetical protein